MRRRFALSSPCLALALATVAPALAQDAGPGAPARSNAERFDAARRALLAEAKGLAVSGSAVGLAGTPGRFYALVAELAGAGQKADFLALLRHEHVVVRAAGMVCLAKRFPEDAAAAIEARRGSQAPVDFQPQGCGVERITEGDLATQLLADADLLESGHAQPRPLRRGGDPRFEAARRALVAEAPDLFVSGGTVGRGAQPGRFYTLVKELEETGEQADFEALLQHEQVVVRAAGMVCLAKRFPGAAVAAIEARQGSKAPVEFQPQGCGVEVITEGELATKLLDDADLLEPGHGTPRPLR